MSRLVRSSLTVAIAAVALAACGATPPPARELANEVIETVENESGPLSDEIKQCMHAVASGFTLSEADQSGFENLDDVADKADGGNDRAKAILAEFEAEMRACRSS